MTNATALLFQRQEHQLPVTHKLVVYITRQVKLACTQIHICGRKNACAFLCGRNENQDQWLTLFKSYVQGKTTLSLCDNVKCREIYTQWGHGQFRRNMFKNKSPAFSLCVVVGSGLFSNERCIKWMIAISGLNIMKINNYGNDFFLFIFNQCDISALCFLALPGFWWRQTAPGWLDIDLNVVSCILQHSPIVSPVFTAAWGQEMHGTTVEKLETEGHRALEGRGGLPSSDISQELGAVAHRFWIVVSYQEYQEATLKVLIGWEPDPYPDLPEL